MSRKPETTLRKNRSIAKQGEKEVILKIVSTHFGNFRTKPPRMNQSTPLSLSPDRYFSSDPTLRSLSIELYQQVADLPIISPHGHVDPQLFSNPQASFGTPADLFIIPDHYVTRMLYSQGVPLEALGVPRIDGGAVEGDNRTIWKTFCENFHLFRGTPSGIWLTQELVEVFGISEKPAAGNADKLYDLISEKLATVEYSPRALFERFNIEVLCTTDAATDRLEHHQAIRKSGWGGNIKPTFRPDAVVNLDTPQWKDHIQKLGEVCGYDIQDYHTLIRALQERRAFFQSMGATATDHAVVTPDTHSLSPFEADAIFQRALRGTATSEDAARFTAHMLVEMARMSIEDGLVMQLHSGSLRNHNGLVLQRFGQDKGCDIPVQTEYTRQPATLVGKIWK